MNISYEYYHIFYYVAKYQSLTQAAEVMHNNQPNISRTMKLLEHEMGCRLMIRSNRGISLTPEGERLYSHIKIAVEQIQSAEEYLMKSTGLQQGAVTIGASETALHLLLLPVLKQYKKSYPDIHIRILNHLTAQAIESVRNKLVDFAVIVTPAVIEKPLLSMPVMEYQDILIGGPSYFFPPNETISLAQLEQYPLVCLGEHTMTYQFYKEFYRSHRLLLKPELEAATTDQLLPMIKNDLGIGYIPAVLAEEALSKKEVFRIPLSEEIPGRRICFVENENNPLSIAATELKRMLTTLS